MIRPRDGRRGMLGSTMRTRYGMWWMLAAMGLALGTLPRATPGQAPAGGGASRPAMRQYDTPFYELHSDADLNFVREAALRLTCLAREYQRRTGAGGGLARRPAKIYIFGHAADYLAAGGHRGSTGMFTGDKLLVIARGERTWGICQHEAFHQFAALAVGWRLPVWVNEGLAEYFSEGVWTGDGLVTGILPPSRVRRVQRRIAKHDWMDPEVFVNLTARQWAEKIDIRNYDQAWMLVHFLVQAEGGRYRPAFQKYLQDIAQGRDAGKAFGLRIGRAKALQDHAEKWWQAQAARADEAQDAEITVATLTSYLARARAVGRECSTAEAFFLAARKGELAVDPTRQGRYWLPASLLARGLAGAARQRKRGGTWKIETDGASHMLVLMLRDGTRVTGRYRLRREGWGAEVFVKTTPAAPSTQPARPDTRPVTGRENRGSSG